MGDAPPGVPCPVVEFDGDLCDMGSPVVADDQAEGVEEGPDPGLRRM